MQSRPTQRLRAPARVVGCLEKSTLTILVCPENGLANGGVAKVLPLESVPLDLRLPNSEFEVVIDLNSGAIEVVQKQEFAPSQ